jgi:hypothetical protein
MALSTKRDEIIFLVVSEAASKLNVVDLKILLATAFLAAPTISIQYPLPKHSV